MALNKSRSYIVAKRRQIVGDLRLQELSERQIVERLASEGLHNPSTKRPYSLGIIHSDLKALCTEWLRAASASFADHQARILAKLELAQREAWSQRDLTNLLRAIKLEMELLGLPASLALAVQGSERGMVDAAEGSDSPQPQLGQDTRLSEAFALASPKQRNALQEQLRAAAEAKARAYAAADEILAAAPPLPLASAGPAKLRLLPSSRTGESDDH